MPQKMYESPLTPAVVYIRIVDMVKTPAAADVYDLFPLPFFHPPPQVMDMPFDSSRKWSLSIHKKAHSRGALTLYIKGAPERCVFVIAFYVCHHNLSSRLFYPFACLF